ncbi:MAG: calcium-translocating P-type ATPase, PMCA-type [Nitrospirota bacterium]
MRWHQMEIKDILEALKTSSGGLSGTEAERRLSEYGPNRLKEAKKKTPLLILLDQFKDFMILVLIGAAIISGIIGDPEDTIVIVIIVFLNALIGFIQEYRAERALEALKSMATPVVTVRRDGKLEKVRSEDIVPGDIIILETGMMLPADLRLIEVSRLKVMEAALTGESVAVDKDIYPINDEHAPLAERKNMAYKGTSITYGRGAGVAVETGMQTELGKIATMLQEEEETKTPLQKRLAIFGRRLAITLMAVCGLVFTIGIIRGEPPLIMFLTALSLAVAAIPESLPAVVTISLAIGARKMVRQNALIRRLPAVETLGSVTYICTDKTGTLTMNKMAVEEIYVDGKIVRSPEFGVLSLKQDQPSTLLYNAMILNNDTANGGDGRPIGDPTEVALFVAAEKAGLDKKLVESRFKRIAEIPFDSDRKCMTTIHEVPEGGFLSITKGAIEVILDKSVNVLTSQGSIDINREEIAKVSERMAADGLRILGLGIRRFEILPDGIHPRDIECDLILIGMVGIMDPPREEIKEAVALCRSAGIHPVMITGDHPITARAIARRIGIIDDSGEIMTGTKLERMPMEEFEKKVKDIRVYARVAPDQKLKIVKALQDDGEFVAMTGDGVNDAPAIKRADIGIAMGITGTDVAKEASDMVLLDDNFATIVRAVAEGRHIYDNIRKFVRYLLTTNSGEIWTVFLAPLVGLPMPLLPIHLLWINLVTDGLPALALSIEPPEGNVMARPPRHPKENLFAGGLWQHVLWVGLLMGGICLFIQALAIKNGFHWQTMVFTVLGLLQMGHVLAIRSERESLFKQGLFSNRPLFGAVFLTFALQIFIIYAPFMQRIFKTVSLSPKEFIMCIALASVVFFAVEIEKLLKRRGS